jgi:hypothetical protein
MTSKWALRNDKQNALRNDKQNALRNDKQRGDYARCAAAMAMAAMAAVSARRMRGPRVTGVHA